MIGYRHRMAILVALCAAALAAVPAAAGPVACVGPILSTMREAELYIRASEDDWAKSVATNDASVVARILADDLVWVLDGELLDKTAAVAAAAAGPGPFVSNVPNAVTVRFFGTTAVAQGSETWTKRDGRRGMFVWTDTWVNRGGCWQIVAAQDTVVPLAH